MNADGEFDFDLPLPAARDSDSETSHAAARIARLRQKSHAAQLLKLMTGHPFGLIADAAQGLLPGHDGRQHKRMPDLRRRKLVEDSGLRSRTRTGCWAIVWVITEKGRQEAQRLFGSNGERQ